MREANAEGRTALHIAAFRGDYVACDRLLLHGARALPDVYSLTPLHYAAFEGVALRKAPHVQAEDVVDLLLKHLRAAGEDAAARGDDDDGDSGLLSSDVSPRGALV